MTDSEDPDAHPETATALATIEPATGIPVPAMIAAAAERAALRFIDFLTANIRNRNTLIQLGNCAPVRDNRFHRTILRSRNSSMPNSRPRGPTRLSSILPNGGIQVDLAPISCRGTPHSP